MSGNRKSHLLIVHRYFWPQNYPYATMLKDIAEAVSKNFSTVTISTSEQQPSENTLRESWAAEHGFNLNSIHMSAEQNLSVFKKILSMLKYTIWLSYQLMFTKASCVFVATTPPILATTIVRWISYFKKYRYIYHCQDIHPEAMLLNGNISKTFGYRFIQNLDKKNIDAAWKVITLSKDMKNTLAKRGCNTGHVKIINNFIYEYSEHLESKNRTKDKIKFFFAGTMGRFQNLEILFEALEKFKMNEKIEFNFMGSGILKSQLEKKVNKAGITNINFLGQRPVKEAVKAMCESHFGIISLSKGISSVAYPSKTMMYLGNGLPVLALVDNNTELSEFINTNKLGKAQEPESVELIVQAIEELVSTAYSDDYESQRIKSIAIKYFDKPYILNQFTEVVTSE